MNKPLKIFLLMYLLFNQTNKPVGPRSCYDDQGPGYFRISSTKQIDGIPNQEYEIQGKCFDKILLNISEDQNDFIVEISLQNKKFWICLEILTISTGLHTQLQFQLFATQKIIKFSKSVMSQNEQKYIRKRGIQIFRSCDFISNYPSNIWKLIKAFVGGQGMNPYLPIFGSKIWNYQLDANIQMVQELSEFTWIKKDKYHRVNYPKEQTRSGDVILITRFDGIDQLIHSFTGSPVGHTAIILKKNNVTYICESQMALYFPRLNIQCNEWDQWMDWAENADYNVLLLPINDEYYEKFDVDKAWERFNILDDTPYGIENFLFVWWDTTHHNLPDYLDLEFLIQFLRVVEYVVPKIPRLLFLDAVQHRFQKPVKNINEFYENLYESDMTVQEIFAIPEQDHWEYENGYARVCSSLVVDIMKHGGIFGDLEIHATEFTPKDLLELPFWDQSGKNIPKQCDGFVEDNFCQILGNVHFKIGKTGTVTDLYHNMNTKCPTQAPHFTRHEGC